MIAFIGSVFSPYYARARRRSAAGTADPFDHCALNVVLYRRAGGTRWAMTERGRGAVRRSALSLCIGPSALRWDDGALLIEIDELTLPWPSRLRGTLRVRPACLLDKSYALDAHGVHRWRPLAPVARVEVEMHRPALRWSGPAYLDSNCGDAALETHFTRWDWSRAGLPDGRTAVLYDADRRDGGRLALALAFDAQGGVEAFDPPPVQALPAGRWGVARRTRSDAGHAASVQRSFEDGPFYTRSLLATHVCGAPVTALHESLSLERFERPWVQCLLPFRMPRRRG